VSRRPVEKIVADLVDAVDAARELVARGRGADDAAAKLRDQVGDDLPDRYRCSTNSPGSAFTTAGLLRGPAVVNRWGLEFQAGDRVVVRDNWYRHADIRNGQTGTITHVDPDTGSVTLRTHVYADTGMRAEHGYTALSRARGETHLWIYDAPGRLGECTHIHGDPLTESHTDVLVRQLTQSVIEPPATYQGLPVASVTDAQLIAWRDQLEATIHHSPRMHDVTDKLVALDSAIDQARNIAERFCTSGTWVQIQTLETRRTELIDHQAFRETWLEQNAGVLHHYSAVTEELNHRINAHVAAYELNRPKTSSTQSEPHPPTPSPHAAGSTLPPRIPRPA
jgi:hypothetical protein